MKQIDPTRPNHIFIGLGGTGGKVLKAFRKRLWEEFPSAQERNKLSLGFVYVDSTDEMMNPGDASWKVMGQSAIFEEHEFVNIKSIDLGQILDNPDNYPGLKRVISNPEMMRKTLGEVGAAAGQKRRAGRLLFAANIGKYLATVKNQYTRITEGKDSNKVHIHIFTGLAGGTGSGSIIDAVAQLRADAMFASEDTKITVYAMVPELNIPSGCQAGRYHQNGYAALCELSALNAGAYLPCDVRTGEEHVRINTQAKKRFGLMVYSNVNENGAVVNSFTELPKLLADTVYFTIFLPTNGSATENFIRGFSNENKNDYLVEYSFTSKSNDKEPARTKAINSFGIKRIVYPEQRVVEHISYTFADNAFRQMAYNNYKEDIGYVTEPQKKDYNQLYIKNEGQMRKWMLTDDFLTLNERILETDKKFQKIDEFWKEQATFNSYDDAKLVDSNPLRYVEQFCSDKFAHDFRIKQGVNDYYTDKCNTEVLNTQAEAIVESIEHDLYSQWYEGQLSLTDLLKVSDEILSYLKKRRSKLQQDENDSDEKIKNYQKEMDDNMYEYDHLNLLQKATGKPKDLYTNHQDIVADFYTEKTYREAYEFTKRLLSKLQADFEVFHDDVQAFVGAVALCMDEAAIRISDRNQQQGNINDMKSAVIEVREDNKVASFEKSIITQKNTIEGLAGSLRRALVGEKQYAHFGDLIGGMKKEKAFEVVDEVLGTKVREIQSNESPKERLTGLNVLQQLQKMLDTDEKIKQFAKNAVEKSGVFILLDDTELGKAQNNNPNPAVQPESMNIKNVLITMPAYEGDDALKEFAEKLQTAFRSSFRKNSEQDTIDFSTTTDTMNEITITAVKSLFPLRALKWLPEYEREYKMLTESPNPLDAREAKTILHSEGDGSCLPPIMGENALTAKEFGHYLFLGVATGVICEGDDDINGHGWMMTELDEFDMPINTYLSKMFTDLTTCDEMTSERRITIQKMVDGKVKDPNMTLAQRNEMLDKVKATMREVVAKECTSTSSPKYQQFANDARKAMEMLKK